MIDEKLKTINWNKKTGFQKHIILMYLYRIETDLENIGCYVETYYSRKFNFKDEEVPIKIQMLKPLEKRSLAYAVIGKEP